MATTHSSQRSVHHPRVATKHDGRSAVVARSSPAARRLATPTDLTGGQVEAIAEAVNPLIADAIALYVKTKNFHWHVSGSHFRDYHLLFDEQAEQILASVDLLAERVRKIGGTTIRSVGHVSQLQTVADDNDDYVSPHDMIQRLLADNRHIAERQRRAIDICSEHHDEATSNTLQEVIDQTEKRIWFLHAISQGRDHTE
jgi:starvation-inducible DNA-binding protein